MEIEIVEIVDFLFLIEKGENLDKICYIELIGDVSWSDTVTS